MLVSLPAETVFEAKRRSRKASQRLFLVLFLIYILCFNLIATFILLSLGGNFFFLLRDHLFSFQFCILLLALSSAWIQFHFAWNRPLEEMLKILGARSADPKDDYHKIFINIAEEAETATGIRPILAVVIASTGCNAFSVESGDRQYAIGVTEGLLSRLDRSELTAVIAHEAAHLVGGDSKISALCASLFGILDYLSKICRELKGSFSLRASFSWAFLRWLIYLLASTGHFLTKLTYCAISRNREFLADACAIQMCKDPLSLAEALAKISPKYRGILEIPKSFSLLFILNPSYLKLDEKRSWFANLFSTHPPVQDRILRLLQWAKTDLFSIEEKKLVRTEQAETANRDESKFFAHLNGQWCGPYSLSQILSLREILPSTWVCTEDRTQILRAGDHSLLFPLFEARLSGTVSNFRCPNCKVHLLQISYEGTKIFQCSFCRGNLLESGRLEKLIARRDQLFSKKEVEEAKLWLSQTLKNAKTKLLQPKQIACPFCNQTMIRSLHSVLTMAVLDRCLKCGAIWCDEDELEKIQILVEEALQEESPVFFSSGR